jgi:aspartate-semialdehyde dehydrogenase
VPFRPRRLLIAYDDTRGWCGAVVPRMKQMLEERAFSVDTLVLGGEIPDLEPYHGVILGAPDLGPPMREPVLPESVAKLLAEGEGIDEKKIGVFTVFGLLPGRMSQLLRAKAAETGAEVVAEYAYWRLRPQGGEHVIPAECMIRIR